MWKFYYITMLEKHIKMISVHRKLYKNKIKQGQGPQQEVNKTFIVKKTLLLPAVCYAEFNA